MVKKLFVSSAKVIQSGFTIGCIYEAVLGAFSVTGKPDIAISAVSRQGIALGVTEGSLLLRGGKRNQRFFHDASKFVLGIDVVTRGYVFHERNTRGVATNVYLRKTSEKPEKT